MTELLSALCLAMVMEGLLLFAMPGHWKRTMVAILRLPTPVVRRLGGAAMVAGAGLLWLLRQGAG